MRLSGSCLSRAAHAALVDACVLTVADNPIRLAARAAVEYERRKDTFPRYRGWPICKPPRLTDCYKLRGEPSGCTVTTEFETEVILSCIERRASVADDELVRCDVLVGVRVPVDREPYSPSTIVRSSTAGLLLVDATHEIKTPKERVPWHSSGGN